MALPFPFICLMRQTFWTCFWKALEAATRDPEKGAHPKMGHHRNHEEREQGTKNTTGLKSPCPHFPKWNRLVFLWTLSGLRECVTLKILWDNHCAPTACQNGLEEMPSHCWRLLRVIALLLSGWWSSHRMVREQWTGPLALGHNQYWIGL